MFDKPDDYEAFVRHELPGELTTVAERANFFLKIFLKAIEDHAPVVLERLAGVPLAAYRDYQNWLEPVTMPAEQAYRQLRLEWYGKKVEIPNPLNVMSEEEYAPIKEKYRQKEAAYEEALANWAHEFNLGPGSFEKSSSSIRSHAEYVLARLYYNEPMTSWVEPNVHFKRVLPEDEITLSLPAWKRRFNPHLTTLRQIKEEIKEKKKELDQLYNDAKRHAQKPKEKRGVKRRPAPKKLEKHMEYLVKFHVLKLEIYEFADPDEEGKIRRAIERLAPLLELNFDRPRTLFPDNR